MRVQVLESHVGPWMGAEELAQQSAHVCEADRIDRSDRQSGSRGFVQRSHLTFQIVVALYDHARAFMKPLAFRRDQKRAFGSVDELQAQMLFQVVHNLAGVGLRYAIGLGGARKAAKIDDVAIRFEEAQMHSDFKSGKRWNRSQRSRRFQRMRTAD